MNCRNCHRKIATHLTTSNAVRYCSEKCRREYRKMNMCCIYCGKELSGYQKEFCSLSCGTAYRNKLPVFREKVSLGLLGKKLSDKHRESLSNSHLGQKPWNKGLNEPISVTEKRVKNRKANGNNVCSEETKRKIRVGMMNHLEKVGAPRVGKNETRILDDLGIPSLLRQHRIEALGYIVDGYDPEANRVFEVYEIRHKKTQNKDQQRMDEIINHLGCDFVIIHDR